MPAARLHLLPLLALLAVVLGSPSAAQARHHAHYTHHLHDYYSGDREPQPRDSHPVSHPVLAGANPPTDATSGLAGAVARTIRACGEQVAELQKMQFDLVVKTVQPNHDQRAALEQIRTAVTDAANKLNANCPNQVPERLADRLDTMRASLDAIKAALLPLRPAFVTAYAKLDDEQKARLVALAISQQAEGQYELETGAGAASSAVDNQAQQVSFGCEQWPAMLKDWPLNRFESELSLSDEQHAALYTLMAAVYRTAARLAESCHDENALTPVVRLDNELTRIDALRQCTDSIKPALAGFINALNDEQNDQLNAILGTSPPSQPQTTTR
jgi:hypothetical protein